MHNNLLTLNDNGMGTGVCDGFDTSVGFIASHEDFATFKYIP